MSPSPAADQRPTTAGNLDENAVEILDMFESSGGHGIIVTHDQWRSPTVPFA